MVQLCEVCLDNFSEAKLPKLLHCGHTFCKVCVEMLPKIGVMKGEKAKASTEESFLIQCPVCREFTHLRVGQELATNFAFLSLLTKDSTKESIPKESVSKESVASVVFQEESKVPLCEECESVVSDVFCQNCESYMCKACQVTSHSSKIFKKHVIVPTSGPILASSASASRDSVASDAPVAPLPAFPFSKCALHSQDLILYCFTCDEAICLVCRDYAAHVGHKVDLMDNVASELHASALKKLDKVASLKESMINAMNLVKARQFALEDEQAKAAADLAKMFGKLKNLLDEKLKASLDRVRAKAEESAKSLATLESSLFKDLGDLEQILKTAESLELKPEVKVIHELQQLNSSQEELLKRECAVEEAAGIAESKWFMQSTLASVEASILKFEGVVFDQAPEFLTEFKDHVLASSDVQIKWKKPLDDTVGFEMRIVRVNESKEEVKSDSQTMFFTNSETSHKFELSEPDSTYLVKLRYVTDGSASRWATLKLETAPVIPVHFSTFKKSRDLKVSEDAFTVTDTGKNGSFVSILGAEEFSTGKHSWRVHLSTLCIAAFGICTDWTPGKADESSYEGLWNVWNSGACTMNGGVGEWDYFGDFACREGDIVRISLDTVSHKVEIKNETDGSFGSFKIPAKGTFAPWFAVYGSKLQLL